MRRHGDQSIHLSGDDGPTWGLEGEQDRPAIDIDYRRNMTLVAT
jgi:hypothetical protein|tara:strand:- start:247 stop:378 length:132 start_codon:yes stop_codon:yes gene_type:complete